MKLLRCLPLVGLTIFLLTPVGAVEVIYTPTLDVVDQPPDFPGGYSLRHDFNLSRTIVLIDARPDPEEQTSDIAGEVIGGALVVGGLIAIVVGATGAVFTGGASLALTVAGISMVIGGIASIAVALAGGGLKVTSEAYELREDGLVPVPNFVVKMNGGTKALLGGWGYADARTGDTVYTVTNDSGKTPTQTTEGLSFLSTGLHLSMTMDDADHDKRFTFNSPWAKKPQQFILSEATALYPYTHNFEDLDDILKHPAEFYNGTRTQNDTALSNIWDMDVYKEGFVFDAPDRLLNPSGVTEYRVVFLVVRRSVDYPAMQDEASRVKSLSDIPYVPRISDTCDLYLDTSIQGVSTPSPAPKKKDGMDIQSDQDQGFGYVDYLLDKLGNQIHPFPQYSASDSMAYALVWGRYEGSQDDGWMTTDFSRYRVNIHDYDNVQDYDGQVIGVCLDKRGQKKIGGFIASRQGYVITAFNYTPAGSGIRSINLRAELRELAPNVTYHHFWQDDLSIHRLKLVADLVGHAGLIEDVQPFTPFLYDYVDYELWHEVPSQFRKYITLRTGSDWIPASFTSAYVEQGQHGTSSLDLTFRLTPNGGVGFNMKSSAMRWKFNDIMLNVTVSGTNQTLINQSFGDIITDKPVNFTTTFSVPSNLTPPAPLNITLNTTFYWDANTPTHRVNITAFGIFALQDNVDNYEETFRTNLQVLEDAFDSYPMTPSDIGSVRKVINTYCGATKLIQDRITEIKTKAEKQANVRALELVEEAMAKFGGLSDDEKRTMYKGTCEKKWLHNYDGISDSTDPVMVGAYIHISYNLLYLHWLINERLNQAMLYINSYNKPTNVSIYYDYAKNIKDEWTDDADDSTGGGDGYVKEIDWTYVVAVIAVILSIISTILIYRVAKDRMIIPPDWMTGWRFAVVLVIFAGIAGGLLILYFQIGLGVANALGAYTSMHGVFG